MEEEDVRRTAEKWIESKHPDWIPATIDKADIGFLYSDEKTPAMAIECKKSKAKPFSFQRAIGQCLYYKYRVDKFIPELKTHVPVYLAVPKDYEYIADAQKIIEYFSLPIGLMTVDKKGDVNVLKEAR